MMIPKLLTWLDVKRVIRYKTRYGSNFPEGIVRISCYSDGIEVGVDQEDDIGKAKKIFKEWFGDWYYEQDSSIQLDFDNSILFVDIIKGEQKSEVDISIRPFWEEIAYIKSENQGVDDIKQIVKLPIPFPDSSPKLISFYSFKGGVGRTLHLAAFLFALLDRAKELEKETIVLVIDADLEAPGLTYWSRKERQQPSVSFIDFLEIYHYSSLETSKTIELFSKELKKTAKKDGKSTWYFLPACLDDNQLLDTPILPENLARGPQAEWGCGDAIYKLGHAIRADFILIDLRAGLSEISSPIIFDPRIQRFIITTIAEQSIRGTTLVIDKLKQIAPQYYEITDSKIEYFDPSIVISMLKPEFKELPNFDNSLEMLRLAYIESDEDNIYPKRLQILETDFSEELLYINDWDDARSKLYPSSIMRIARDWAKSQIFEIEGTEILLESTEQMQEVRKLRDICKKYEFAENGQGERLLITEPLKNLATMYQDEPPMVVSIGAKGAGKTFNYIQLSQFGTWENFLSYVYKEKAPITSETYIFPVSQSNGLRDEAKRITQDARIKVTIKINGNKIIDFSPLQLQDRIKSRLEEKIPELQWTFFWIDEIARAIGLELGNDYSNRLSILNTKLKELNLKVIFLFDGLEDIFSQIHSDSEQQKALKALIDLPIRLSEIRKSNIGLIVFVRRDFIRYAVTQNLAQFENLYRAYDLSWDEDSFRRLVFWVCSQAHVIDAKEEEIENLSRDDLSKWLEKLWGMKLGTDNSKEAFTINWVFAALTDFKGRLQARDIVRFLLHASDISYEKPQEVAFEKWSSNRLLPPQAIRRALEPCSQKKVQEAKEEYPEFKEWVEKISQYPSSERRIPFTLKQFDMDQATVGILEEIGAIYEDREKDGTSRFYMPEIFRAGLDFSLDKGARPRVLVLKRKALGPGSL